MSADTQNAVNGTAGDDMDDFYDFVSDSAVDQAAAKAKTEADAKANPWACRFETVTAETYSVLAPPIEWLLRDLRNDRKGSLPRGIVGQIIGEGGCGKTRLVAQLVHAVATGGVWLSAFDVHEPGRCLIILGEEKREEMHRRLQRAAKADLLGRTPAPGSIIYAPLRGIPVHLVTKDSKDSPFLLWLRTFVKEHGPFDLIVIEPLSKFAAVPGGQGAEVSNDAGTRFVTALESLTDEDRTTILISAHTNKASRGGAEVTASSGRGSSSIGDACRWTMTASAEKVPMSDGTDKMRKLVTLEVKKVNYAADDMPPLVCVFDDDGSLVPLDGAEQAAAREAKEAASPGAKKAQKKTAKEAANDLKLDAAVIDLVTKTPGMSHDELLTHLRAATGLTNKAANGAAIARARIGHRIHVGIDGRSTRHYIGPDPERDTPEPQAEASRKPVSNGAVFQGVIPDDIEATIDAQLESVGAEGAELESQAPTPAPTTTITPASISTSMNGATLLSLVGLAPECSPLDPFGDS